MSDPRPLADDIVVSRGPAEPVFLASTVVPVEIPSSDFAQVWDRDISFGYRDETVDAADAGAADVTIFRTDAQTQGDEFLVGSLIRYRRISFVLSTVLAGATVTLEVAYWSGAAWTVMTAVANNLVDGTNVLKANGDVTFDYPADWATTAVNGSTQYWIRFKLLTANPTTAPVGSTVKITASNEFSPWTNIGSYTRDLFIYEVYAYTNDGHTLAFGNSVELGYGEGPTPLDMIRYNFPFNDPANDDAGQLNGVFHVPGGGHLYLPAGETLKARAALTTTMVLSRSINVYAWGYSIPKQYLRLAHGRARLKQGRYVPSLTAASGISLTTGLLPNMGGWVELISAAPNDLLLAELCPAATAAELSKTVVVYQFGYSARGKLGEEVAAGTMIGGLAWRSSLCNPPVLVRAGERALIRAASTGVASTAPWIKVYDLE